MGVVIDLNAKKALVTGAGAGIGREIARWLARAGADVAILDIRRQQAEETAALLQSEALARHQTRPSFAQASARPHATTPSSQPLSQPRTAPNAPPADAPTFPVIVGDARDDTELTAMINKATKSLGGLDIAVNNIGMIGPAGSAPWLQMTPEKLRDVVEQNLIITGVSCIAEAKLMEATGGVIFNITSGETTRPSPNMAGYGAAKVAINHLSSTLAVELGQHNIRVLSVAPGTTLTETVRAAFSAEHYKAVVEATPLRRETQADELGRLIVFLASDLAHNITGQLILADAGAHLSRTRPPNLNTASQNAG